MILIRRLLAVWDLWRVEGYDGRPTTLRHAYEIAAAMWTVREWPCVADGETEKNHA